MIRARQLLKKGFPVGAGVLSGALAAMALAGPPAAAGAAQMQDPAVQMQIQQALSNFQVQLQTQLNLMQSRIDTLERQQQSVSYRLDTEAAAARPTDAPTPADPVPGVATWGRLVSRSSESERFVLTQARGDLLAQLAMTSDGPGLVIFDANGGISAALLATPDGPELRMADAEGTLHTVLSGR